MRITYVDKYFIQFSLIIYNSLMNQHLKGVSSVWTSVHSLFKNNLKVFYSVEGVVDEIKCQEIILSSTLKAVSVQSHGDAV